MCHLIEDNKIFCVFFKRRSLLDVTTIVKLVKFALLVSDFQFSPESTIILSSDKHKSHRIHASLHFDLQASVLVKIMPTMLTVWKSFDKYPCK